MKKFLLTALLSLCLLQGFPSELVLIRTKSLAQVQNLMDNPNLNVHFYNSNMVIATAQLAVGSKAITLDPQPWGKGISYYLVYYNGSVDSKEYLKSIEDRANLLFQDDHVLIVSTNEVQYGQLPPAKNDGMVRIHPSSARLPSQSFRLPTKSIGTDPFVEERLEEVSAANIKATVQHLQDYGTRNAYHSQSIVAQEWIAEQFQDLDLSVEVMDFTMPGGPASDNVIAVLPGTKYPNEYVIVGSHYDSISSTEAAPGADDNASGTAAVLEIARILSEHPLDRTVVFCSFSGEEYGLYGSKAYASRCRQQNMNILGYFNLDMIGYLQLGNSIMTSLIYPQSAQPLATFYTEVCTTYLPSFIVQPGTLIGGDSDHTSFNQQGYMGIFPFENSNAYSPYIHTPNDVVGTSFNNQNQAAIFTKASLASVITLANMKLPPSGLSAVPGDNRVSLTWNALMDIDGYNVYRNGEVVATTLDNTYEDTNVTNFEQYTYHVTALYSDSGNESEPSNQVSVIPVPPISLPLFIDFENGAPYWSLTNKWGISIAASYSGSSSLSESPIGNYENDESSTAQLAPFSLNGYTDATLSFWTKYETEGQWDYMYLEISTDGIAWNELAYFTGKQSQWDKKTFSLQAYLNHDNVFIRFRFVSDFSNTKEGMFIDDFRITVTGPSFETQVIPIGQGWSGISSYIIPVNTAIETVMEPIAGTLCIIQNLTLAHAPEMGINSLTSWDTSSGYMIKSTEDTNLSILGEARENGILSLSQGWNLIPVFSRSNVEIQALFQEVADHLVLLKEVAGNKLYWPAMGISSLEQLVPGKAYLVLVSEDCQVQFPIASGKFAQAQAKCSSSPWLLVSPTPRSHVIGFPSAVIQSLEVGDFIGAFTPSGSCAGIIQIDDLQKNYALVAYGDDISTTTTDGFLAGEPMELRAFLAAEQTERVLAASYSSQMPNEGLFENEGLSVVEDLEPTGSPLLSHELEFAVYPNPASEYVFIAGQQEKLYQIRVFTALGVEIFSGQLTGNAHIPIGLWSDGVYFVRASDGKRQVTRLVIVKK